ncbi:P63C domain-containing protein [Terrimicrobium sacchariphilum]|uniref:P63C domain-containing protein n=1 Tax=Terrimicrobium sacchariphilum TaxID=690879 RepID=A0A146G0U0_TERSA|nr:P63C domain-containing protein [Terrimicrobium sacchariphilum]GAT31509.1 P63C domain-containing protein [Terrimicrobium sacchariphilum]
MRHGIAGRIIEKFGGQSALATLIGKGQTTVQYWASKGHIPAKWQPKLLELAEQKGIDLSPADFIATPEVIVDQVYIPKATHWGSLKIGEVEIPCYVLENGIRVFSLKGIVVSLIGTDGGQLAEYLKVKVLQPYLPKDLIPAENGKVSALFQFDTGASGIAQHALGLDVEKFMDLCGAYSSALQNFASGASDSKLTARQMEIAVKASTFLRAAAKTGIVALVDEATGYQYDRPVDALQLKMKIFLEEEMRKWEKTFPDQLWVEFGRLTKWSGQLHHRPKYWGKLVMELIYGYLDKDVAKWLKDHAPKPIAGQNYHQWMSSQYGLKKLIEHIWMVVGMASACETMSELRRRMAEKFGRIPVQLTMYLPPKSTGESE